MNAAQMAIGDPVQGRLDVPGGAAGGCWQLTAPPGRLQIALNFDRPDGIEKPTLRITDDIGRTLSNTGIGSLGSGATLTHHFTTGQTIIVELTAAGGASHFGMRAEVSPVDPPPSRDAGPDAEVDPDEGVGRDDGPPSYKDRGPRLRPDAAPLPPPCPDYAVVRIIPSGDRAVTLTVRLPPGSEGEIDWSGPIAVVDDGKAIASARLDGRSPGRAEVFVKGMTTYRAKGVAVRFACAMP